MIAHLYLTSRLNVPLKEDIFSDHSKNDLQSKSKIFYNRNEFLALIYILGGDIMQQTKILKFKDGDFEMEIPYLSEEKNIWLSIKQISEFFHRDHSNISRHIAKIFELKKSEKHCAEIAHCNMRFSHFAYSKKQIKTYNLETVLQIGNRIKSRRGLLLKTLFEEQLNKDEFDGKSDKIIIYDDGTNKHELNFSLTEETVWANQSQIAEIFETTQENVSMHIRNILEDKELGDSVYKDFLYTASDSKKYLVTFYNLDMILAVGYRVRTSKAIFLRRWVSEVFKIHLKELYSSKGSNCIICRNDILELQRDMKQMKLDSKKEIVYYDGEQLRGFIEVKRFIETAKEEIILVDNYIGHSFDEVLSKLTVKKTIITSVKNKKIDTCDTYTVVKTNENHDRYVLVDNVCYTFSSSLEELGEKTSSSRKITDMFLINSIKNLKNNVVQKEVKEKA